MAKQRWIGGIAVGMIALVLGWPETRPTRTRLGGASRVHERLDSRSTSEEPTANPPGGSDFLRGSESRSQAEIARLFLHENRERFHLRDVDRELLLRKEDRDPESGWTEVWLDQLLGPYRVLDRHLRVHVDPTGSVRAAHGRFEAGLEVAALSAPATTRTDVEHVIRKDLDFEAAFDRFEEPQLVVSLESGKPALVWDTHVTASGRVANEHYQVDAHTGLIHHKERYVMMCRRDSGYDFFGNHRPLEASEADSDDTGRKIVGYDQRGRIAWISSYPIQDSDNPTERQQAEAAGQYNLGRVLDYWSRYHNRTSWDNEGGALHVGYHAVFEGTFGNLHQGNAQSEGGGYLRFGDGDVGEFPYTTLGICAHEFTHEVLFAEGVKALSWKGEAIAIHEGLSDTFACLVEYVYGHASGEWNFRLGDEAVHLEGVRDMASPPKDHYSEFDSAGEQHENGGIVSYAMYLLWMGGKHTQTGVEVNGIGPTVLARVCYKAITDYLDNHPNFGDLREAMAAAAAELYGENSPTCKSVQDAFEAIGIPDRD